MSEKDFDDFMSTLAENIKNLGARIKQTDKKIEKRLKEQSQKSLQDLLSTEEDYRALFTTVLNMKMLE